MELSPSSSPNNLFIVKNNDDENGYSCKQQIRKSLPHVNYCINSKIIKQPLHGSIFIGYYSSSTFSNKKTKKYITRKNIENTERDIYILFNFIT